MYADYVRALYRYSVMDNMDWALYSRYAYEGCL